MITWFVDKAWPSIISHPAEWIAIAALALTGWYSLQNVANASDFKALQQNVTIVQANLAQLSAQVRLSELRRQISDTDSQLFAISRDIARFQESKKEVPELYLRQQNDLTKARESLVRDLSAFQRRIDRSNSAGSGAPDVPLQ